MDYIYFLNEYTDSCDISDVEINNVSFNMIGFWRSYGANDAVPLSKVKLRAIVFLFHFSTKTRKFRHMMEGK